MNTAPMAAAQERGRRRCRGWFEGMPAGLLGLASGVRHSIQRTPAWAVLQEDGSPPAPMAPTVANTLGGGGSGSSGLNPAGSTHSERLLQEQYPARNAEQRQTPDGSPSPGGPHLAARRQGVAGSRSTGLACRLLAQSCCAGQACCTLHCGKASEAAAGKVVLPVNFPMVQDLCSRLREP